MDFPTSLIIVAGFVLVVCFGVVKVIWDLSEMSVHAPPEMLPMTGTEFLEDEQGHANAGTARFGALGTITEEFFDSLFGANVKGLLFTVQKALPLMPPGGVIVLNASVGGYKGRPANGVYSATKAAVRSFARTWTNDLKDRQIRVNAISPGVTETQGFRDLMRSSSASDIETLRQRAISSIPLGRLGTPDDIAKVVVFLASADSSYIAGAEVSVDGGFAQV